MDESVPEPDDLEVGALPGAVSSLAEIYSDSNAA